MINRLQFRHDNTLYDNISAIRKILDKNIRTNKSRLALYAEPIVFKYGDEESPNIVLAIGNYGSGEYDSLNNYFLIDTASLESNIIAIKERLGLNDDNIAEIKEAISNISDSVNKNKTDIANLVTKDTELDKKIDDSVVDITKKISDSSDSLKSEISTMSGSLSSKIDETSDELHKRIYEEISGITLSYNRTEQTITLKSKSGQLLGYFGVQDFIKDGMIKSVVLTDDKTNIVITWNDGSVVTIPLNKLIDVYTISKDSESYLKINDKNEISVVIGSTTDYNGLATYTQLHDLSDIVGSGFKDTTITSKVNLLENRLITITEISDKTVEDALKLADKVSENTDNINALTERVDKNEENIGKNYSAITALTQEISEAGKVDDVQVNGKSVVKDKIANIDLSELSGTYETDLNDNVQTVFDVGGIKTGTKVSDLTGKTISEVITEILFPEIYPTRPTLPSISSMSYDSGKNNYGYTVGTDLELSEVSAVFTKGSFNSPSGYSFVQPTPVYTSATTFTFNVETGFTGYNPTASATGITSGSASISLGRNMVTYTATLSYNAPTNSPITSRNESTSKISSDDTENSAVWTTSATTMSKSLNIYGLFPCFTNISGTTLKDTADTQLNVLTNTIDKLTINNIPSEVANNQVFIIEYPSGRNVNSFLTDNYDGSDTSMNSSTYKITTKAITHTVGGKEYYYDRLETITPDKGDKQFYKFTFSVDLSTGGIEKEKEE